MEIMFRGSEFQDKRGYLHPFYLTIYNHSLGERSVRRLGGAEATFSVLRSEWEVES